MRYGFASHIRPSLLRLSHTGTNMLYIILAAGIVLCIVATHQAQTNAAYWQSRFLEAADTLEMYEREMQ